MKRDFDLAGNIVSVIEFAPKALAGAKKILSHVGAAGAAGTAMKLSPEGLAAKAACERAVAKAEAAVERAAKAAERGGSAAEAAKEAVKATKEAGAVTAKLQKFATEAEAVRRVSNLGPVAERPQNVEAEAVSAGHAWAHGIQEAIRSKAPLTSAKSTLRGPGGRFLRRKAAKPKP